MRCHTLRHAQGFGLLELPWQTVGAIRLTSGRCVLCPRGSGVAAIGTPTRSSTLRALANQTDIAAEGRCSRTSLLRHPVRPGGANRQAQQAIRRAFPRPAQNHRVSRRVCRAWALRQDVPDLRHGGAAHPLRRKREKLLPPLPDGRPHLQRPLALTSLGRRLAEVDRGGRGHRTRRGIETPVVLDKKTVAVPHMPVLVTVPWARSTTAKKGLAPSACAPKRHWRNASASFSTPHREVGHCPQNSDLAM